MAHLLSVEEAAERLGVKASTIRSWVWKRQIEFVKISGQCKSQQGHRRPELIPGPGPR